MFFTIGFFIELIILFLVSIVLLIKKKKDLTQKWREYDHRKLLCAETELIEIAKWIEGEKIHHDPGRTETEKNAFVILWIKEHAADVRKTWELSQCRVCSKSCFHYMKRNCTSFTEDKNVKVPKKGAFIFWVILAILFILFFWESVRFNFFFCLLNSNAGLSLGHGPNTFSILF